MKYLNDFIIDFKENSMIYIFSNEYNIIMDNIKNFSETQKNHISVEFFHMNYPQAKDLCVSRFSDFSNENASPCFCFKSVVQSLNQTIFYLINLVIVN